MKIKTIGRSIKLSLYYSSSTAFCCTMEVPNLNFDCIQTIFDWIPEDEWMLTVRSWLQVNKFFNKNQQLWKILFSRIYPCKLEGVRKGTVVVIKDAFMDWKNQKDHKEVRINASYMDFRYHEAYDQYVDEDLMDYAMKTRNLPMALKLRDNQRFNCFRGHGLYERSLRSALIHGNIEAFNIWFEFKKCAFHYTRGVDALWINPDNMSNGNFAGIHMDDVRKMVYNGHLISLQFLEQKFKELGIPQSVLVKWLERMDLYRLVKTRQFKSIEYLIEIGAKFEFDFASTGRQGRRDDRGTNRLWSYNNNPYVVVSLLEKFGEKLGLANTEPSRGEYSQARLSWGAVMACVRACFCPNWKPRSNDDPLMPTLKEKARKLMTHSFVTRLLVKENFDENDHRMFRFLGLNVFPKHIEGCELTSMFYHKYLGEVLLDKKISQTMWNATIHSVAICTNREETLKLLTTTFVTKLLEQVEINSMQMRILQEKGFVIAPKCLR